jgi:predicted CXXCH cytochrome family protein
MAPRGSRSRLPLAATLAAALGGVGLAAPTSAAPAPERASADPAGVPSFTPIQNPDPARLAHPHGAGDKALCQVCHEPGVAGVKKDPIALCVDCHDPARMRHAFRVEAPQAVGKLPLMDGNVVACHTCHDPHDPKARRAGLRAPFSELCLVCHARHAPGGPGQKTPPVAPKR